MKQEGQEGITLTRCVIWFRHNRTHDDLFGMNDWISVLKDAMQTQYDAGNLKGYLDYKQFWDFLDNK